MPLRKSSQQEAAKIWMLSSSTYKAMCSILSWSYKPHSRKWQRSFVYNRYGDENPEETASIPSADIKRRPTGPITKTEIRQYLN